MILSRVRKPSRGTVTCSTVRAIETVLNLLYIGAYLNQSSVNHIKWLPQESRMASAVAVNIHILSLPLKRKSPSTNRKMLIAPRYIGPAVKGCGPQYIGRAFTVSFTFFCPA